jgi:hypothetical protein
LDDLAWFLPCHVQSYMCFVARAFCFLLKDIRFHVFPANVRERSVHFGGSSRLALCLSLFSVYCLCISLCMLFAACLNPSGVCLGPRITHSPSGSMSNIILWYRRCVVVMSPVLLWSFCHFPVAARSAR